MRRNRLLKCARRNTLAIVACLFVTGFVLGAVYHESWSIPRVGLTYTSPVGSQTRANHSEAESRGPRSLLVGFVGYPGAHKLMVAQAEGFLYQGFPADVVLYSDVNASLQVGNDTVVTVPIPPLHRLLCQRTNVVKNHWCSNRGDNKFLGAVLHANSTRHGFDWFLLGDDDTTFLLNPIVGALEKHNPQDPHWFAVAIDYPESSPGHKQMNRTPTAQYTKILQDCPVVGPPGKLRYASLFNDKGADVTETLKDCDAMKLNDPNLLRWGWAHGGSGMIFSAGLLDRIPAEAWQKCVDRLTFHGSDVRLSMCVGSMGYKPEHLKDPKGCRLSEHKIGPKIQEVIQNHVALCRKQR